MNYITVPSSCSVDMLRFRMKYSGEPGAALEWFDKLWADIAIKFGKSERTPPVRYPRSLRVGTYRELIKLPTSETSIEIGFGRNGKGDKSELREGYLEFNPAKAFPSPELKYVYTLLGRTVEISLELVRWDFATDYPLSRDRFALLRDRRKWGAQIREAFTEYLGTRNNNGFVKLYDKQKELQKQGKEQKEPLTRLEITIEEKPGKAVYLGDSGKEIPCGEWPKVACVPETIPESASGQTALVILAWKSGNPLETCLQYVPSRSRTRIRNYIAGECGLLKPSEDYDRCRKHAQSWAKYYGGLYRNDGF